MGRMIVTTLRYWITLVLSVVVNLPSMVMLIDNMSQGSLHFLVYLLVLMLVPKIPQTKVQDFTLIAFQVIVCLFLNPIGGIGVIFLLTSLYLNKRSVEIYGRKVMIFYGAGSVLNQAIYPKEVVVTKLDGYYTLLISFCAFVAYSTHDFRAPFQL